MMANKSCVFRFGDIEVREREFSLTRAGEVLSVEPKAFRVLLILLRNPRRLISKEELLNAVWGDTAVSENSLARAIALLRRLLGDESRKPRYIETVATVGYRLVCDVEVFEEDTGILDGVGQPLVDGVANATENPSARVDGKTGDEAKNGGQNKGAGRKLRRGLIYGGCFVAVGLAVAAWFLRPQLPPPQVTGMKQLTQDGVPGNWLELHSPLATDGSRVYFERRKDSQLMQISIEGGDSVPIGVAAGLQDISPNGLELLLYLPAYEAIEHPAEEGYPLWQLRLPGTEKRQIGGLRIHFDNYNGSIGTATWSPDGSVLYYCSDSAFFRANADGSHVQKILTVAGHIYWLRVSPDGRLLRFSNDPANGGSTTLWEARSDGSHLRQLLPGFSNGADLCCGNWTTDGKYFVFQSMTYTNSTLWAMRETVDLWHKVNREPVQLTPDEMGAGFPLPSRDGKRIFFDGVKHRGEVMRYEPGSHSLTPLLPGFSAAGLSFTKDGQRMAYVSYPEGTLWQSRTDGSDRHQLTFPPIHASLPRWSPDSSQLAFTGNLPGKPSQVFVISAQGGDPEQITFGDTQSGDASWSPDGNSLLYAGPWDTRPTKIPLRIVNVRTRKVTEVPDSAGLFSPRWSPDGRYLLAIPLGKGGLTMYDLNLHAWQQLVPDNAEVAYQNWTPDSKCIYFNATQEKGSPEYRICLSDRKIQHVADMAQAGPLAFGGGGYWTGLAPDGSILALRDAGTEEIYALDVKFP